MARTATGSATEVVSIKMGVNSDILTPRSASDATPTSRPCASILSLANWTKCELLHTDGSLSRVNDSRGAARFQTAQAADPPGWATVSGMAASSSLGKVDPGLDTTLALCLEKIALQPSPFGVREPALPAPFVKLRDGFVSINTFLERHRRMPLSRSRIRSTVRSLFCLQKSAEKVDDAICIAASNGFIEQTLTDLPRQGISF